jgi:hypothetical protein
MKTFIQSNFNFLRLSYFKASDINTSLDSLAVRLYLILITLLTVIVIIELKHMYNIDIFPNLDTPFDNVYFDLKAN